MAEFPPLADGATHIAYGSGGTPYEIKNVGGVYSCSCPGWRNQGRHPHYRSCKHLIDYRSPQDEARRIVPGGREGMPSTVSRPLAPYWPMGAGLPSLERTPASRVAEGIMDRAPLHVVPSGPISMSSRVSKVKVSKPDPVARKPHNAWTALMDDDHPLAEPIPPPPPANDLITVGAAPADEPAWEGQVEPVSANAAHGSRIVSVPPVSGAFGVLLAQTWDGVQNVTGWLMSEKLDGIRAYWDGEQFRSRLNNVFATPDWYRERMPKGAHLDGELWMGRGRFQETTGYVRRMDRGEHWRNIQYQIFDAPSVKGGFEERFASIGRDFTIPAHCTKLPHLPCPDIGMLKTFLAGVEAEGGEGVMLRQPGSRYFRGRSGTLLKVKTFFDTEVVVFGTMPGKGRHVGAVGALRVRAARDITLGAGKKSCTLRAGTEFEVGTGLSDVQRRIGAIPNGAIVTVRFQELSKDGIPRFPSMIAVRNYE